MTVLGLLITILLVGVVLWVINAAIPMDARVRSILNAAVVILLVLWMVDGFLDLGFGRFGRMRLR
jgi:hypothetical protein